MKGRIYIFAPPLSPFLNTKKMYRKNWWQYVKISKQGNFNQDFNRSAIGFHNRPSKIFELNFFILRLFRQDGQTRHAQTRISFQTDYLVTQENLKILKQLKRKATDATIHCALLSEYRSGMIHRIRSRPKQSNRFIHSLKYEYLSLQDRRQDGRYL